jgi:serine/threonine-protein kinase RsbW
LADQINIISRKFDADTSVLADLRAFVEDFAERAGLTRSEMHGVVVAVDEAATNIIKHASPVRSCSIGCSCYLTANNSKIVYEISWEAAGPFNPDQPKKDQIQSRLESRLRGGLGVFLMHHLVDEIEFEYKDGLCFVRLGKKIGN